MNANIENALRLILDHLRTDLNGTALPTDVLDAMDKVETYLNSFN